MVAVDRHLRLLKALDTWVEKHPGPKTVALVFLGREYSVTDIRDEVARGSGLGREIELFLLDAADRHKVPVEEFVERATQGNVKSA